MTIGASKADVYTDFKGLAELRLNGSANPDVTLRAAGRQFEALFIQMMLKSMREAPPGDPLLGSNDQKTYQEMFDKEIALTLSGKGSLGLADGMVRQLQQGRPATPDSAASSAAAPLPPRPAAALIRRALKNRSNSPRRKNSSRLCGRRRRKRRVN